MMHLALLHPHEEDPSCRKRRGEKMFHLRVEGSVQESIMRESIAGIFLLFCMGVLPLMMVPGAFFI